MIINKFQEQGLVKDLRISFMDKLKGYFSSISYKGNIYGWNFWGLKNIFWENRLRTISEDIV
jgi:hypothetical protein